MSEAGPTPEELAALRREHGKIMVVEAGEDAVAAFRRPTVHEHEAFLDMATEDNGRSRAVRQLVRDCVVWPAKDAFDAMLKEQPGLVLSFGGDVIEFAGTRKTRTKKY